MLAANRRGAGAVAHPALADENGVRVYFVENRDRPFSTWRSISRRLGFDTADKSGLASMTIHLLRLGADA